MTIAALLIAAAAGQAATASPAAPAPQAPRRAQGSAPAPDAGEGDDEVVVTAGRKPPGSAIGDIPPDQSLSPADIRSYGVSNVSDLLTELGPQLRSGVSSGPPVVLLNGRRISGFQEIRDLPAEAILRVDILPEEVALNYGYRADQRVINFVLRPRFRAVTTELSARAATDGGTATPGGEFDLLKLSRQGRLTVHLEYSETSALTEAERGVAFTPGLASTGGNIAVGGGEIDPRLSALAGRVVTVAAVPGSAVNTAPGLADFVAGANQPSVTDPRPFRTLLPASRQLQINSVYATTILGDVSATINTQLQTNDSRGLFGLPGVSFNLPAGGPYSPFAQGVTLTRAPAGFAPLQQGVNSITGHLGTTLNGRVGRWQWTFTGTFDRTDSETLTDAGLDPTAFQARLTARDPAANPYGPLTAAQLAALPVNQALSTVTTAGVDLLANGTLFRLPAGGVAATFRAGGQSLSIDSDSLRAGVPQSARLGRSIANGNFSFELPITSRREHFLDAIGNLSANVNLGYDGFSDFGVLRTLGYGFNWSPIEPIRLIGQVTEQDQAPSVQQLGNPVITTPNVRIFDYVRGENATVTLVSGGNPGLVSSNRRTQRLGLTLKPWEKTDFTVFASYADTRVRGATANFPSVTAAIQAAFPDRFTRDAQGALLRVDTRPVNFAETESRQFRYGFNFSVPIKSKIQKQIEAFRAGKGPNPFQGLRPPGSVFGGAAFGPGGPGGGGRPEGQPRPGDGQAPPPGAGGPGGPGGGGFRGGGFGGGGFGGGGRGGGGAAGGRLQFALYHTIHLAETVQVAGQGPRLDLLNGDTVSSGGGQPRHELEAQAGYNNNGLGARLSANWQSATRVNGGVGGAGQSLRFGALATVNLRLFADLGQRLELVKRQPWVRGMRVSLSLDNVFNSRQLVTDPAGATPIAFQGPYLDPTGRTVRLVVRKLFF